MSPVGWRGNSYFNLENSWRGLLAKDPLTSIEVRIAPKYSGESKVPDKFVVDYRIDDGDWGRRSMKIDGEQGFFAEKIASDGLA
ncbi:hypothetical protein C5E10_12515 [Pseudoclavibacter sp. RFBG4]|uniref:DNA/RNA non-specific endonuclease n=1 Tax=Pseudoclavibacter sp. RFBG4 TaxID=2080575 RepID=UPI000CE7BCF6|nr:DNA/RNA non-specific endonuclease [Pseudoclavibacter sp. RFBG4]PPG30268.1 hypothetical protein C5E10_12515 [Pseudoclavibacter sp. RFBG4]